MIAPALARADTVTDWNGYASTAIVATATQPPPVAVLSFAMVQGAVYDAVNAIDRGHRAVSPPAAGPPLGLEGRRGGDRGVPRPRRPLPGPAGNAPAALRRVARRSRGHAARREGGRDRGRRGSSGGDARRASQRRPLRPVHARDRDDPGRLAADAAAVRAGPRSLGRQRPAVPGPRVEMLRTDGPNALTSRAYARDFNEVKTIGALNSTTRTADETDAAIFWQDHAFALWNRVFRTLAASQHLNIVDSARLFASENLAAADAAIGCWNNKYHWNFWRPITAIREAASDGTGQPGRPDMDAAVRSVHAGGRASRARHAAVPRSPVGPPCAAGAIVGTLQYFFGTDQVAFSAFSNKSGTTRTFAPLLRRAQGEHRRARLGRDPLPGRRRPGRQARQHRRALPPRALPPTGRLTPDPEYVPPGQRPGGRCRSG